MGLQVFLERLLCGRMVFWIPYLVSSHLSLEAENAAVGFLDFVEFTCLSVSLEIHNWAFGKQDVPFLRLFDLYIGNPK
jgi:hypothetical protein